MDDENAVKFRSFLVQRFEDTLSPKKALLDRMERNTGLKRGELILQIDILKGFLKGTFGKTALVLEGMVAKQICRELVWIPSSRSQSCHLARKTGLYEQ